MNILHYMAKETADKLTDLKEVILDYACGGVYGVSGNRPMPADSPCTLHFKYFWVREQHQESNDSALRE